MRHMRNRFAVARDYYIVNSRANTFYADWLLCTFQFNTYATDR